jgi:osmotically-inducible protein OsmY
MKKFEKIIIIASFCVTSFACAQSDQSSPYSQRSQYSQYPQSSQYGQRSQYGQGSQASTDMNSPSYSSQGGYSQSSQQAYGQQGSGQYQDQSGSYGAGNQGNQSRWSNWFGGNDQNQNQSVPDNVISSRIMQNLRSTPYLSDGAQNIQVQTKDGTVTLKGKVSNSNEKNLVEYMVKNVAGVKSVSNDLDTAQ